MPAAVVARRATHADGPGLGRLLLQIATDDRARPPVSLSFIRHGTSTPPLRDSHSAVVDVETTGFSSWLHDRAIEVTVLRTDPHKGFSTSTARS